MRFPRTIAPGRPGDVNCGQTGYSGSALICGGLGTGPKAGTPVNGKFFLSSPFLSSRRAIDITGARDCGKGLASTGRAAEVRAP